MKKIGYNLSRELKEVGFPQKKYNAHMSSATLYYSPSLEDLIDEIGANFGSLEQVKIGWRAKDRNTLYNLKPDKRPVLTIESTKLEAVAFLYIKLNKEENK